MFLPYSSKRSFLAIGLLVLSLSCSRLEETEKAKLRKENARGAWITRKAGETNYLLKDPLHTPRAPYPWESETKLPKITKEFFRCKGNPSNPPILTEKEPLHDCVGGHRHGLPIIHGKEGVYPILIELLNYVQKKTGKKVIILSGHRCPAHNTYVDPSKAAKVSKHQIGAEVDFYVEGMEEHPQEVVRWLLEYYQERPEYQGQREYQQFQRYLGADANVAIHPWMNREIYIKLSGKGENQTREHPEGPYITVQVRFDRALQERVRYSWAKAHQGYSRGGG